jgi:hypothetical protein
MALSINLSWAYFWLGNNLIGNNIIESLGLTITMALNLLFGLKAQ